MKDTVGVKHPDYDNVRPLREKWQDIVEGGTQRLRDKRKVYFPQFPKESDADYAFRCDTATLFNIARKTRDIAIGLLFHSPITLESDVPSELVKLWEDTDNEGTHGDVFWRRAGEAAFEGYAVILEDNAAVKAADYEQQLLLGLRPYSRLYTADNVWNWRHRYNPVSKRRELEMLVLRQITREPAGRFLTENVTRYLHIENPLGGSVIYQWYKEVKKPNSSEVEYIEDGKPGIYEAQTEIPVAIVGKLGAPPPLIDIVFKNIEHAQTYSDYKHVMHKTCVPFPVRVGYEPPADGKDVDNSTLIDVPVGGSFEFAEVAGSSIGAVRQSLIDNREEMALMGLSILADKTAKVDLTATEALLNNIGETAELRVIARSIQDAIETTNGYRAKYLGLPKVKGGSVTLGTSWDTAEKQAVEAQKVEMGMNAANAAKQ